MIKVLKFGGSVLKDAKDLKNIKSLIESTISKNDNIIVVMSALNGITNNLIELAKSVASSSNRFKINEKIDTKSTIKAITKDATKAHLVEGKSYKLYNNIIDRHLSIANELGINDEGNKKVNELLLKMQHTITAICDNKKMINELQDTLLSYGERLSSLIFYLFLRSSSKKNKKINFSFD